MEYDFLQSMYEWNKIGELRALLMTKKGATKRKLKTLSIFRTIYVMNQNVLNPEEHFFE